MTLHAQQPSAVPPRRYDCLTLTTDYGQGAGFVGTLHAVAFGIAPHVKVIDLDHSIPPQDVRLGALRLERFMTFAPPGVHVGVVDPGVGGSRRAIAATAGPHAFVGPDNGLLSWALDAWADPETQVVVLDKPELWLQRPSRTFDGRDIFVPVAAHLACGSKLSDIGTAIDAGALVRLARPVARTREDGVAELEVLQVDGFGNVQTSGSGATVAGLELRVGDSVVLSARGARDAEATYGETFADVAPGRAVVLIDSDGCLALSVNCGRADALFDVGPATAVTLARP